MTFDRPSATRLLASLCFHPASAQLPPHSGDWDPWIALALEHGVAPLIHLRTQSLDLPEQFRARLRALYLANLVRSELALAELSRILQPLRLSGCPAIPLKGAHLSQHLYNDPAARQAADLDIFIPPESFPAADSALAQLGYLRQTPGTPERLALAHEVLYHRRADAAEFYLDVQLRLSPGPGPDRLAPRDKAEALTAERLLVFLCVNHVAHRFSRLKYVADVERSITIAEGRMDWDLVASLAQNLECSPGIWLSLLMAFEIAGAAVPHSTLAELRPGPLTSLGLRWAEATDPFALLTRGAALEDPPGALISLAATRGLLPRTRLLAATLFPRAEYMRERYGPTGSLPALHWKRLVEKAGFAGKTSGK